MEFLNNVLARHRDFELRTEMAFTRRVWDGLSASFLKTGFFKEGSVLDGVDVLTSLYGVLFQSRIYEPKLDRLLLWVCNAVSNFCAKHRHQVADMSLAEFDRVFFEENSTAARFHDVLNVDAQLTAATSMITSLLDLACTLELVEGGISFKEEVILEVFGFPFLVMNSFGNASWSSANKRAFIRLFVSVSHLHPDQFAIRAATASRDDIHGRFLMHARSSMPLQVNAPYALAVVWLEAVDEAQRVAENILDEYENGCHTCDNVFLWILKQFVVNLEKLKSAPSSHGRVRVLWRNTVLACTLEANTADGGVAPQLVAAFVYVAISRRQESVARHRQLAHCLHVLLAFQVHTVKGGASSKARDRLLDAATLDVCAHIVHQTESLGWDRVAFVEECDRFGCTTLSTFLVNGGVVRRRVRAVEPFADAVAEAEATKAAKNARRKQRKREAKAAAATAAQEAMVAVARELDTAEGVDSSGLSGTLAREADEALESWLTLPQDDVEFDLASLAIDAPVAEPAPPTPPAPEAPSAPECVVCLEPLEERRALVACCGIARVCGGCGAKLKSCPFCRRDEVVVVSVVV
jgi:hypothetical protein